MKSRIKKIYVKIKNYIELINLKKILKKIELKENIFLIGSPLHGNIGDHAISIAEMELLKKTNKNIIEIPGEYFNLFEKLIISVVKPKDIIVITGGGFLGTLWMNEEKMVRKVVRAFPMNKVIIMPQTIYFERTKFGKEQLKISKTIFEQHKFLYIFLRDKKSYDFCLKNFKNINNIYYVPDIVTYLNYEYPILKREGILFCLRKDKEKVLSEEYINKITEYCKNKKINLLETTTVLRKNISLRKRYKVFVKKLNEFKKSKIVITDRLHGMIFAAITATPCIAFDNLSGKVHGVYEWINYLNYIKILETNDEKIYDYLEELMLLEEVHYDNSKLVNEFDKILKILL